MYNDADKGKKVVSDSMVVGRFWASGDRPMWDGYVDLGILGRVRARVSHNETRRDGKFDCDLVLTVTKEDTPIGALRRLLSLVSRGEQGKDTADGNKVVDEVRRLR